MHHSVEQWPFLRQEVARRPNWLRLRFGIWQERAEDGFFLADLFSFNEVTQKGGIHSIHIEYVANSQKREQQHRHTKIFCWQEIGVNRQQKKRDLTCKNTADPVSGGILGKSFQAVKHGVSREMVDCAVVVCGSWRLM